MNDLFNVEEDKVAAAQGWGLYHVYDMATDTWRVSILPAEQVPMIVHYAKQNHPLPLKALRLMTHYKGPK